MCRNVLIAAAVLVSTASPANAATISWRATGTIDFLNFFAPSEWALGSTFTVTATIDTTAPNLCEVGSGLFNTPGGTIQFGNVSASASGGILEANLPGCQPGPPNMFFEYSLTLQFDDWPWDIRMFHGAVGSSAQVPTSMPFSGWFWLVTGGTSQDIAATGTLSQFQPVPEPTSMALLGAGLAGLVFRRMTRQRGQLS
jgi:hypothetical protein